MTLSSRARPIVAFAAIACLVTAISACVVNPGDPGAADVTLSVNASTTGVAISPLIYGTNDSGVPAGDRPGLLRQGGNRMTAYNWEFNPSNAGSDYCFENDTFLTSSTVPGAVPRSLIEAARARSATALLTVPMVDYVAGDFGVGDCQDVRNSGPDYLTTRMKRNVATKGSAFTLTPNATDTTVYEDEFVNWAKQAAAGVPIVFNLDNEPDLWSSTHAEVHPSPVTYQELVNRTVDYAKAIKAVWPTAKVAGFVSYGFYGYERLQGAPDNGGRNFVDYFLQQMKAADTAAGHRLVDYLDLHYYSEATGNGVRVTGSDTSAAVSAAREQAPRSLWDPSFTETSWITDPGGYNYGPIKLLPRVKASIATNDPGVQPATTEWNFGAGGHISGAIATADTLGIFGQQRVGLAAYWPLSGDETFSKAAFRAYRNFDGAGGQFGDLSIPATSSSVPTATVYASRTTADPNKVVIIAINKATTAKTAAVKVIAGKSYASAKVFTITAGGGASVHAAATINPAATNAWRYTMPAQSISIIVPQ